MPHLSPMNWILAPFLFLLVATSLLISSLWWSQTPSFPLIINTPTKQMNNWNWI